MSRRICVALCLSAVAVSGAHPAAAGETERITIRGVQAVLGEHAMLAPTVKEAPVIDGDIMEPAYRQAPMVNLHFIDERTPGYPRSHTHCRMVSHGGALHVGFECRELRQSLKKSDLAADDKKIFQGSFVGLALDLGAGKEHRYVIVLSSPFGVTYTAAAKDGAEAWDTTWNPDGLTAVARHYADRWFLEMKLPLKGALADLPKLTLANLFRKRLNRGAAKLFSSDVRYRRKFKADPVKKLSFYNYYHSARPLLSAAKDRKEDQVFDGVPYLKPMIFAKAGVPFFAPLVIEDGKGTLKELDRILAASQTRRSTEDSDARLVPKGFELSRSDLEDWFGEPALLVPSTDEPPTVDGEGADPAWKRTPGFILGYLLDDVPGLETRNPTRVKILTDKEDLYVYAHCTEENVEKLSMNPKKAMWTHDTIELLFDVGHLHNYSNYYHIQVNPAGKYETIRDRADHRWKPKSLEVKAKIQPGSWQVELKIAIREFGVAPDNFPKLWGANFARTRWVNRPAYGGGIPGEDNWDTAWRANSHTVLHVPDRWGHIYLQAGNAASYELELLLKEKGKDPKTLGLKRYREPRQKVVVTQPRPEPVAEFNEKPRIKVEGRSAEITFSVKQPVDVAVEVLDEKGRIVRHLAAGVLGKNPPDPLLPNTLEQKLTWDFKDDQGKELPEGKYRVRVGLGMGHVFDRVIGWSPYEYTGGRNNSGGVRGITAGPEGTLYVILSEPTGPCGLAFSFIRAFDREGKYLRQIYPVPGNQPVDRVKGISPIVHPDSSWAPPVYQGMTHTLMPWTSRLQAQTPAVTKDGRLIMVSTGERLLRVPKRLLAIGTDGSVAADMAGPVIVTEEVPGQAAIAVSPDGLYYYVTGLRGRNLWPPRGGEPHHVVYRCKWNDPRPPANETFTKPFIGEFERRGTGKALLNNPRGVACDPKGNVLVADYGNNRVVTFSADGVFMNAFQVQRPLSIQIHPRTGHAYVLCGDKGKSILRKFESGKQTLETQLLPTSRAVIALDASKDEPLVWVAYHQKIIRVVEKGGQFKNLGDPIVARRDDALLGPAPSPRGGLTTHDPETQEVFVGGRRYDGNTGKYLGKVKWLMPAYFGPDRHIYAFREGQRQLFRFKRDGAKANFAGTGKHVLDVKKDITRNGNGMWPYHHVNRRGEIVIHDVYRNNGVSVWDLAGKKTKNLFVKMKQHVGSAFHHVRSDSRGAVYLGTTARRAESLVPKELQGRLPSTFHTASRPPASGRTEGFNATPRYVHEHFTGSVMKFGPEGGGGELSEDGDVVIAMHHSGYRRFKATGMKWLRRGFGPILYRDTENNNCNCESALFDIDPSDRLYIPNALQFQVQVVDRNNNLITVLGGYGNADESGMGTSKAAGGMAFAWPMSVSAGDRYVYVGDPYLRRIIRAKVTYRKEDVCELK